MTGEIFDIKRFAVHDGPGIRCTAFLKGCPLRCIWCQNPEGLRAGTEIAYLPLQCIGCGACTGACQSGAIRLDSGGITIDRNSCTRCGACADICPTGAILPKGREISPAELVAELAKDEVFFRSSNGGITLSGGEPLFRSEFTAEVLRLAKVRGYHTAVETCLYLSTDTFRQLIDLPDLWIVDLKIWDDKAHQRMTGRSNRLILANYEQLVRSGQAVLTRIPVIPDCTDAEENLTSLGRYIAEVNPVGKVEPLFYNPLAESKYRNYGIDYPLLGTGPYTAEAQNGFRRMIAATGANVL